MRRLPYVIIAVLFVLGVAGGAFAYLQVREGHAAIEALQASVAKDHATILSLTGDNATLAANNEKLSTDLSASKEENSKLVSDRDTLRSRLKDALQYQDLLFCDGTNPKWSVQSVDSALTKLDTLGLWDFRSGLFQSFRIWTDASAQYVDVRATSGGKEYGYPFLVFPVAEMGVAPGIWSLTEQCWVSRGP